MLLVHLSHKGSDRPALHYRCNDRSAHEWLRENHTWRAKVLSLDDLLGLGGETHELLLLGDGLELAVTMLGGSIDELNVELVSVEGLVGLEESLSDGDLSLSGTHDGASKEEEILVDDTVMGETTDGGDVLGIGISLGGSVVGGTSDSTGTDVINLLVHLSSVVITEVTSSSDRPLNGRRMPGTNTSDLSETSMSLSRHSADTESLDDTLSSLTSGDGNGINHLVLLEDLTDGDLALELLDSPVDLVLGAGATVDLDLHKVSLLLSELQLLDLGSNHNSDDGTVLRDSLEVSVDVVLGLGVGLILVSILGESLLLGAVVVLVESSDDTSGHGVSPDSGESTETSGSLNVTLNTDNLDGRALDDGDGIDDILLDGLLTFTLLEMSGDVSHTSLVTAESSDVNRLGLVISGVLSDGTLRVLRSALGQVTKMTLSRVLEFSMRHDVKK